MKVLLDENLPHALRRELPGHDVYTVQYVGWNGVQNGLLLQRAVGSLFNFVVTKDSGIPYQQVISGYPLTLIVLIAPSNDIDDIRPLLPQLRQALLSPSPGTVVWIK